MFADSARGKRLLLVGYFLAQVLFVFLASDAYLLRVDDSYYYFGIAKHAAEDGRFTFDGIHLTNGFQPLWEFVLVGITAVARTLGVSDRYTMVQLYLAVCAALNTLSAWLAFGLVDQHLGRGSRASQAGRFLFLWFPGLTVSLLCGMESCVNWPLLLGFFRLLADGEGRIFLASIPRRRFAALVAVSVLLVYARLDNALILAVTVVYLWIRERSAVSVKKGVVWGSVTIVCWVPLLVWGQRVFFSPTPVSGLAKLWNTGHFIARHGVGRYVTTVVQAFVLSILGLPVSAVGMGYYENVKVVVLRLGFSLVVGVLGIAALGACVLLVYALRRMRLGPRAAAPSLLPLLATVSAVHLLTLVTLFPDQWMYAGLIWYDLVEYLCLFVLVGWIGGWVAGAFSDNGWRRLGHAALAACVLSLIPMFLWRPELPTEGQIKLVAARWINEHLPSNAVVASDDAGALGYFARVPVINLDGLVNTRAYLDEYLRQGRKKDYLKDAGVTHLADVECPKTPTARFRSMLRLPAEGQVVYKVRGNEDGLDFCIVEIKR